MDNLPVHYAETTKALIESVRCFVKFLPPYSPDLSPIELCLSKLKEFFVLLKLAPEMLLMKPSLWLLILLLMKMLSIGLIIVVCFLSLFR
jgi:hypothetical protein